MRIHVVPMLLGGVGLFEHVEKGRIELETARVVDSPAVTHLGFSVLK